MAMDVKRDPAILKAKRRRQAIMAGIGVVILIGISAWVMTLEPAAPTVDHNQAWTGKVTRGSMVREVRGSGTLVPEDIRWITATTSGRVERLVLRPGAQVKPDTVILELSNPDLQNRVRAAELSLRSAEAQLQTTRSNLATSRLQMEADVANAKSDFDQQNLQYEADLQLAKQELVSALALRQSQAKVERLKTALGLAEKRLQSAKEGEASQLAPQEAQVAQLRATWQLEQRNVADLKVKAGMTGQLQVLPVEVGQQVGAGTQVARVANPGLLKAVIRVSETQTRDVREGQAAVIDTRSGTVRGFVSRIDPAAQGGTVGVDITLEGDLPQGARPDLSVDGVIELEKLDNVLKMQRPSFGQDNATISLYKVGADDVATRVQVQLGRASVSEMEVKGGLNEGDEVILSDMSSFESFDRIRIVGRR